MFGSKNFQKSSIGFLKPRNPEKIHKNMFREKNNKT